MEKIIERYNKIKNLNQKKNIVVGFGITEKTIASLRKADGLVVGSVLCKEISNSIKKRQNPVTNVTNIVLKLFWSFVIMKLMIPSFSFHHQK